MKKYQNSTQNINISVEYFNNDNFKSINSLKKIDLNKYYKLLKPHVKNMYQKTGQRNLKSLEVHFSCQEKVSFRMKIN